MSLHRQIPAPHPLTPAPQVLSEGIWLAAYEDALSRGVGTFQAIDEADAAVTLARRGWTA